MHGWIVLPPKKPRKSKEEFRKEREEKVKWLILFYETMGLDEGYTFLEVGLGSGYGAALAREVVGPKDLVVSIEIDPLTFRFAKRNLEKAGYDDIVLVMGDGCNLIAQGWWKAHCAGKRIRGSGSRFV